MLSPTTQTTLNPAAVEHLQTQVRGAVILPGEPAYDQARQAWNLAYQHQPALIVMARSAADVAEAVRFARAAGLGVAVQATGHGVIRPADGALLINLAELTGVRVDTQARTAWVEGGVQWGRVLEAAQAAGLAPLLGSSPGVGAVGYTLGGGLGWLARKYGLSTDSVRALEVVTADGQIRRASASENSDLFWALRGGGGGFGVVTAMEIQLYPVTTVFGGNLIYPVTLAREVLTRYRSWIATLPEAFTTSVVIMNFPPVPDVPEFLRGQTAVIVRGLYAGPADEGQALLDEWLEWHTPLANLFREMPFSQVATVSNDPHGPLPSYGTGAWMRTLSDDAISTLLQYGIARPGQPGVVFAEVRHVGGALNRVAPEANAFGHRDAELLLSLVGMTPTPAAREAVQAYTAEFKRALQPSLTGGLYANFLDGAEARAHTAAAYTAGIYRRLQAVKAQYDPEQLFRYSYSIQPAQNA